VSVTDSTPESVPEPRRQRRAIHIFFVLACTTAGGMFIFKLHEFLRTIKRDELVGFAHDPILVYAFVAIGFLLLLAWAFLTGQFRDIEGTKYEMLERVERQERAERLLMGGPKEYRE
jgi:nitrogen fixation-related uncharacterized protein